MKKTQDILRIGVLSLIISIGGSYAFAEWTAPTAAPPGGNTPPSVNVGGTTQVKNGNFGLGTGYTFWATRADFGKATSLSTVNTDSGTTLVTKDYVDSKGIKPTSCPAGSAMTGIDATGKATCANIRGQISGMAVTQASSYTKSGKNGWAWCDFPAVLHGASDVGGSWECYTLKVQ